MADPLTLYSYGSLPEGANAPKAPNLDANAPYFGWMFNPATNQWVDPTQYLSEGELMTQFPGLAPEYFKLGPPNIPASEWPQNQPVSNTPFSGQAGSAFPAYDVIGNQGLNHDLSYYGQQPSGQDVALGGDAFSSQPSGQSSSFGPYEGSLQGENNAYNWADPGFISSYGQTPGFYGGGYTATPAGYTPVGDNYNQFNGYTGPAGYAGPYSYNQAGYGLLANAPSNQYSSIPFTSQGYGAPGLGWGGSNYVTSGDTGGYS